MSRASLTMPSSKHRAPTLRPENPAQPHGLWITFSTSSRKLGSTVVAASCADGVAEPAVRAPSEHAGRGSQSRMREAHRAAAERSDVLDGETGRVTRAATDPVGRELPQRVARRAQVLAGLDDAGGHAGLARLAPGPWVVGLLV